MTNPFRCTLLPAILAILITSPSVVNAQSGGAQQVISANPFGLLLGVFNAEYERKVSQSSTIGLGGSILDDSESEYYNADVFYRFYPSAQPLDGWAFGVKVGVTRVTDFGSYIGLGFDVNRSWLLGQRDNFSVGLGFGLKRLYGTPGVDEDPFGDVLKIIPTFRVVNIGFVF
jgi:hypothetical protein